MDIQKISDKLEQDERGIWRAGVNTPLSYPDEGNDVFLAVEDRSFWFKHRNNCISTVVERFISPADGVFLDVGGGNGFVSLGLCNAGFDVVWVEPGPAGAANARQRGLEHVICSTSQEAGFHEGVAAGIGLFDVVEHIEDDTEFLRSLRPLLKPSGHVFITVPAFQPLWSHEDELAGHFRRYTLERMGSTLAKAGFEVAFASYIFRFLPPAVCLSRTLPYRLGLTKNQSLDAKQTLKDHHERTGLGGRILDKLLARELTNLGKGKPMRFGGSCLVAARPAERS